MASVRLASLTKIFGQVTAIDNIDLEIDDREFFVLLGPTGAGKTTTLRLVAGLEKPDQGEVYLDNVSVNDISPALRDVAFVFQYYTLYPHYTVRQNLEFPLKPKFRRLSKSEIGAKVSEVAKILHIESLLERETVNLSGGEMQRVAIGRAIVRTPKVFLMDEPLSNLDAKLREEMRRELTRLHLDLGFTFFYVTHDQIEAMTMGDRIAVLNQGKILQIGTPDKIYNSPENVFVAKFVGSPTINLLEASIETNTLVVGKKTLVCTISQTQRNSLKKYTKRELILGIRPEDIEVSKEKKKADSFKCTVYFTQSMGVEDILNLRIDDIVLRAVVPPKLLTGIGDTVYASINMKRSHLFDPKTNRRL